VDESHAGENGRAARGSQALTHPEKQPDTRKPAPRYDPTPSPLRKHCCNSEPEEAIIGDDEKSRFQNFEIEISGRGAHDGRARTGIFAFPSNLVNPLFFSRNVKSIPIVGVPSYLYLSLDPRASVGYSKDTNCPDRACSPSPMSIWSKIQEFTRQAGPHLMCGQVSRLPISCIRDIAPVHAVGGNPRDITSSSKGSAFHLAPSSEERFSRLVLSPKEIFSRIYESRIAFDHHFAVVLRRCDTFHRKDRRN